MRALDNWCRYLTEDEALSYTEALQLRKDGSIFRRLERINKWLTGVYDTENFMELAAADEHSAWVERANARPTFLDRASGAAVDLSWANLLMDVPTHSRR